MEGKEHMLTMPSGFFALRIAQLVLAVILLALGAFGIAAYDVSYDGVDLILFTAIATLIVSVYIIVAMQAAPAAYNYWAILALDIFATVFWLISFAILASNVVTINDAIKEVEDCFDSFYGCYKKRAIAKRFVSIFTYRDAMAATSALGGVEFLLFVITTILTGLAIQNHRANGGHCTTGVAADAADDETKYSPEAQAQDAAQTTYAPSEQQYAPQPQHTPQPQQYAPAEQQYPPQPQQYAPQEQQYPPQHPQQYAPQPEQQYPPTPVSVPIH